MNEVLFLDSPMKEKIYGGHKIQEKFHLPIDDKKIGEYWIISAHKNGPSKIHNGIYQGEYLSDVYKNHKELFADENKESFPLLIKINEVTQPVSVQVHPNDDYARKYENDSGKAEFCLWMDVEPGTKIIRGHTAQTKEEFLKRIENREFDQLFIRKEVKDNEFVYTPAGTVHGIEGRLLMAEVQQSSDATYRIYDYDRVDANGQGRKLHIKKASEVTTIPHKETEVKAITTKEGKNTIIQYVDSEFFKVTRYQIQKEKKISNPRYSCLIVLDGEGQIKTENEVYSLKAGDGCIITSQTDFYTLEGNLDCLVSESK